MGGEILDACFPSGPELLPTLADIAARLAQRGQQDVHHKRKLRGQREGTVLDPCRLALDFTLDSGAGGGGGSAEGSTAAANGSASASTSRTDLRLEASDLRLTLSPDVLDLGTALASSALAPLMQASGDSWEGRSRMYLPDFRIGST